MQFKPDVQYWLNATNTYRVVFIQSQASWFVVSGNDFVIDAHNIGGIQGNGQPWWSYFQTHAKADGDGRPISLTLYKATRGTIRNFRIVSPPFWANTAAESSDIIYDGMYVNATNTDPLYVGKNAVPNTDGKPAVPILWVLRNLNSGAGINTYRSDNISMFNWDVTCGDDCLAIKGNSSNIVARNITCRGGNGIAFGSLGQYANMSDNVSNVLLEDLLITRIDPNVQPNMANGVYFKTWTGAVHGSPPTGGGGGSGSVDNVVAKGVRLDRVNLPLHIYQTNGGHTGDAPSTLKFSNLNFTDWTGTAVTNKIVDIECSSAVGCSGISFDEFDVAGPIGQAPRFICQNVQGLSGLTAPCNATGEV
ncbi:hypothetical protein D9615_003186 [Tricholomella constricta]|uniref:galacturonan 1,4-alpha-galacturonidase n=1 Tax=Tricholomella constricta TaxID=117010 RepID=A0A8H5HIU5_9AGAR|nr:hypothetical protein D9615_003186 [Tricholomella constricta]